VQLRRILLAFQLATCCAQVACSDDPDRSAQNATSSAPARARAWRPDELAHGNRFLVLLDRPASTGFELPGARITRRFARVPAVAVTAERAGMLQMYADPRVRAIEPDEGGSGLLLQAEPLIGLDMVKTAGFRGTGLHVAVIDSGVDGTHPDLAGRVVDEACFCGSNCCPDGSSMQLGAGSAMDDNGHGTHVAGTIASQGSSSPEGGAPGVGLVAVKVLDSNLGFCCMSDVIDALDWVATNHPEVKLVNLSLGANSLWMGDCDVLYTVLSASIDALRQSGTLVIAASGNDSAAHSMRAPACVASTISVGAVWDANVGPRSDYCTEPVTAADLPACYSNASDTTDLLAPGGVITSTWLGGGTQDRVGTSHAAPMVTACAAALLEAKPLLTPDQLEQLLETTGRVLTDAKNGISYPRVDCAAALAAPLSPEPDAGASADAGVMPDAGRTQDAGSSAVDAGVDAGTPTDVDAGVVAGEPGQPTTTGGDHHHTRSRPRPDAGTPHDAGTRDAGMTRDASTRDAGHEVSADADASTHDAASGTDRAMRRDAGTSRITRVHGSGCACRTIEPDAGFDPLPICVLAWTVWRRCKLRTP
jgi:hypothetical protein